MLTFEASGILGTAAIVEKLQVNHISGEGGIRLTFIEPALPAGPAPHRHSRCPAFWPERRSCPSDRRTPCTFSTEYLRIVTNKTQVEGSERPMSFTQAFNLQQDGGSYYVLNDVFRLVYPAA